MKDEIHREALRLINMSGLTAECLARITGKAPSTIYGKLNNISRFTQNDLIAIRNHLKKCYLSL